MVVTAREQAVEDYKDGSITLSSAASQANLTIWEMQKYLVEKGFMSKYSIVDLLEETAALAVKKQRSVSRIKKA